MVPFRLIIKRWRKNVARVDEYTVDKNDPEQMAAYEKRKEQKTGMQKVPYVLANIFKKVFGSSKKGKQAQHEQPIQEPDVAPDAVPFSKGAVAVHHSVAPAQQGYAAA